MGPRLLYQDFTDFQDQTQDLQRALPGIVGGVQIAWRHANLFAEATLAYLPRGVYQSVACGGVVFPAPQIGLTLFLGEPHRWPQPAKH